MEIAHGAGLLPEPRNVHTRLHGPLHVRMGTLNGGASLERDGCKTLNRCKGWPWPLSRGLPSSTEAADHEEASRSWLPKRDPRTPRRPDRNSMGDGCTNRIRGVLVGCPPRPGRHQGLRQRMTGLLHSAGMAVFVLYPPGSRWTIEPERSHAAGRTLAKLPGPAAQRIRAPQPFSVARNQFGGASDNSVHSHGSCVMITIFHCQSKL